MANLTVSTDIDSFMQSADKAAARTSLGVAYGSSSGTVAQGNDSRLSDARTPTTHASTHAAAGSDPITITSGQISGSLTQNTSGTAAGLSATLAIASGGTGAITQQAAINALAGATTSGQFLRGNGTNVAMSAIQAGDVPTLNQNTTGTASNVTGTVAIANGGTAAITAQAAISSLGVGMRMVEAQTNGAVTGTIAGNVFTVTATGVFIGADNYTIAVGDIIAFTLQADAKQNGFWEVTTVGAVGVQAVFTRPAWFANASTVRSGMYMTRFGTTQSGYVMALYNSVQNADIIIGTSGITIVRVSYRTQNATTQSNQFGGRQTFLANSTTNAPFQFQAGAALVTTPVAHYVEWFNDQMYLTNAAGVRTTNTSHVAIPATATSSGQVGQIAVDNAGSWLYVCTATNVWKRVLLTTF